MLLLPLHGCNLGRAAGLPQDHVLPDPRYPHQVSREMTIYVWANEDGTGSKKVEEEIHVVNGDWWLVSDRVLNPTPTTTP